MAQKSKFPCELLENLPEVSYPFDQKVQMTGWLIQGKDHQVVLWEVKTPQKTGEHSHPYPEWGIVISGKTKVTIGGSTKNYKKGDEIFVPANMPHSSEVSGNYRSLDIFMSPKHVKAQKRLTV